jgi:hypothetical protein
MMPDHCTSHERFDINCVECRVARRTNPVHLHDLHQAWCPSCRRHLSFTNSPSMREELRADGAPADDLPQLIEPIASMFQGNHAQIFPVHCPCGKDWMAFVDIVNREQIAERTKNLEQMLEYNPRSFKDNEAKREFFQNYTRPVRRMVLVSREEFAQRVAAERNLYVREALQRKVDERRLGVDWNARPKLVARLVKE